MAYLLISRKIRRCGFAGAAFLLLLGGCHSTPASTPYNKLTREQQQGYIIFHNNCAACHLASDPSGPHGPSLQGLFKKQYLPSGAPANDDRVRATILHGRNMMPPFAYTLDDRQINLLLAYLHTL